MAFTLYDIMLPTNFLFNGTAGTFGTSAGFDWYAESNQLHPVMFNSANRVKLANDTYYRGVVDQRSVANLANTLSPSTAGTDGTSGTTVVAGGSYTFI